MTATDSKEPPLPPDRLERIVQECTPVATAAAHILSDYAGNKAAGADWDSFVRHNWVPVLSLALGPHWQTKYESEVAAIIALQLSVQPPPPPAMDTAGAAAIGGPVQGPGGAVPAPRSVGPPRQGAPSAAAPAPQPVAGSVRKQQQQQQPAAAAAAAFVTSAPVAPFPMSEHSGFAAIPRPGAPECVDLDGKRRRLRRKRAASPELCSDRDDFRQGGRGAQAVALPAGAAFPPPPPPPHLPTAVTVASQQQQQQQHSSSGTVLQDVPEATGGNYAGAGDSSGCAAVASGSQGSAPASEAQQQPPILLALQSVITQVSQLALGAEKGGELVAGEKGKRAGDAGQLQGSGQSVAQQAGQGSAGGKEGEGGEREGFTLGREQLPQPCVQGQTGQQAQQEAQAQDRPAGSNVGGGSGRGMDTHGGDSGRGSSNDSTLGGPSAQQEEAAAAAAANAAAAPAAQLLQYGLLDSLSLVQDLSQRVVSGLTQAAAAQGLSLPQQLANAGPPPLSMLLGGTLVDRMDLLGRAAVHVAAASGRADVVKHLVSARCAVNKPLPMDFRTLLDQHPDMEASAPHHPPPRAKRQRMVTGRAVPPISAPSLQYCTALHLGALYGHLGVVEALLAAPGCDLNARSIEGATPLHVAAFAGETQVVARLCRAPGVQLDARDHLGRTPLHVAAALGWDEVVVELWAKGAAIDCPDVHGWTALHYAACNGHAEVAGKLIIAGSHVQAAGPEDVTPAHLAAERGYAGIVEKVLLAGYVPDSPLGPGSAPAVHAVAVGPAGDLPAGCCACVREAEAGAGVEDSFAEGEREGGQRGRGGKGDSGKGAASASALEAGLGDDDLAGATALHLAATRGHLEVVEKLLRAGAHPQLTDSRGRTALDLAVANGQFRVCPRLLDAGCNPAPPAAAAAPAAAGAGAGPNGGKAVQEHAEHQSKQAEPGEGGVERSHLGAGRKGPGAGAGVQKQQQAQRQGERQKEGPSVESMLRWLGAECAAGIDPEALLGVTGEELVGYPGFPLGLPEGASPPTLLECAAGAGRLDLVAALLAQHAEQEVGEGQHEDLVAATAAAAAAEDEGAGEASEGRAQRAQHAERGMQLEGRLLAAAVRGGALGVAGWLLERAGGEEGPSKLLQAQPLLLHAAAQADNRNMVQLLLPRGADPRQLDAAGRTALSAAAAAGAAESASLLFNHPCWEEGLAGSGQSGRSEDGAGGLASRDARGWSALHYAAAQGLTGLAAELAAAVGQAGRDAVTDEGCTALHLAARAGHIATTYALLGAKCSPIVPDGRGWMPLHYVAQRGDLAFFNLLFATSAPHLTPAAGASLLTCAIQGGSSEMVGILLLTGVTCPARCAAAGEAPVHVAAAEGFVDALRYLQGVSFDMTGLDRDGRTPLHQAPLGFSRLLVGSKRGVDHAHAAAMLVAAGCSVDAKDLGGRTPLHLAAGAGCSEMVARFLPLSEDWDSPDVEGCTPLFWACQRGHAAAAEALLARGANAWAVDCWGRLPLHYAAEGGCLGCVRALAAAMRRPGADGGGPSSLEVQDQSGQTPVALAAEAGHPECVAVLLDQLPSSPTAASGDGSSGCSGSAAAGSPGAGAAAPGGSGTAADAAAAAGAGGSAARRRTALHLAAARGLLDIAEKMLATRRCHANSKDGDGWLPLHHAAAGGHAALVRLLLGAHSDMDDVAHDGDTALHKAALGGHAEVVQLLIAARCQVDVRNSSGSTPLYNAASQGNVEVLRELLDAGATVDAPTTNGCTPLYIAANNGFPGAASLLLEAGANPDGETHLGCSALHAAALNGHTAVAEVLLEAGCDTDVQSQNGSSALHNAASGGHAGVVAALLAANADCDVQNSNGNTPLHLAAAKGWSDVADKLLAAGADVHIRNSKGWTAAQSAANSGLFDIVLRLVQHGAAWRHKGESDVVRLLSKKSSYKASYIEGRLRLAEKEHHRRRQQHGGSAADASGSRVAGPGLSAACVGGAEGGSGSAAVGAGGASSEEALREAAAAADAVMQELLRAELEEKERAERQRAKKQAKKQQRKSAAVQQAQLAPAAAAADEETGAQQAQQQAQQGGPSGEGQKQQGRRGREQQSTKQRGHEEASFDDSANEHAAGEGGKSKRASAAAAAAPAAMAPPTAPAAATAGRKARQPPTAAAAQGAAAAPKSAPIAVLRPKAGAEGGSSISSPLKLSRAAQRAQQQHGAVTVGSPAQTRATSPAGTARLGGATPGTKKAAGIAQKGLVGGPGLSRPAAGAQQAQQQQQQQQPALATLRPAGPYAAALAGKPLPPLPQSAQPAAAVPAGGSAALAAQPHGAGRPVTVTAAGVAAPPPARRSAAWAASVPAPAASQSSGPAAEAARVPPLPPPRSLATLLGVPAAAAPLAPSALPSSQVAMPHQAPRSPFRGPLNQSALGAATPAAVPGVLPGPSVAEQGVAGIARHVSAPAAIPQPAAAPPAVAAGSVEGVDPFVPLFGLQLPPLPGLASSIDWSMPSTLGSGPVLFSNSPGATHRLGGIAAAAAAHHPLLSPLGSNGAHAEGRTQLPGAVEAAAANGGGCGGGSRGGSGTNSGGTSATSPSEVSSIESEADNLLNGIHSHVIHALATQQAQHAVGSTSAGGKPLLFGAGLPPPQQQLSGLSPAMSVPEGEGDGIDDVLRLQPWLHD